MQTLDGLLKELRQQGISDKVLDIMKKVDRKNFVPAEFKNKAYLNTPLPIGPEQTISQPYTVGFMLDKLELRKGDAVLEIGAGSGWNSALISKLTGKKVYTVEIVKKVAEFAKQNLKNYDVKIIVGDGSKGYQKQSPYDRIIVTTAADKIPEDLIRQLKPDGILLIPLGPENCQEMTRITKLKTGKLKTENLGSFVFVALK